MLQDERMLHYVADKLQPPLAAHPLHFKTPDLSATTEPFEWTVPEDGLASIIDIEFLGREVDEVAFKIVSVDVEDREWPILDVASLDDLMGWGGVPYTLDTLPPMGERVIKTALQFHTQIVLDSGVFRQTIKVTPGVTSAGYAAVYFRGWYVEKDLLRSRETT